MTRLLMSSEQMELYQGPLDGQIVTVDTKNNYFVFACAKNGEDEASLYVCYERQDDKLIYVGSKTKEQLLGE